MNVYQQSLLDSNTSTNSDNNRTQSSNISIIFMDSSMPIMTGIESTQLLRQLGYNGPIIGVTGNMMKEDVDQFMAAGATEVMGKPLKLDQLNELLTGY